MLATPNTPCQQSSIRTTWHFPTDLKVLAADYDGTLADRGRMSADTVAALRSLRAGGFRLILVSGRRLDNIRQVCGELDLFDAVILENGAVSFCPATGTEQLIAPAVDERFLADLARELPGEPLFVGRSMVATAAGNAGCVEVLIALGGYDLEVVGCGRRILVLPKGINKRSGLSHALASLGLHRDQVIAVGDEENDMELFKGCALTAAVGNAAPELKATANLVLPGESGQSVQCLVDMLLTTIP
ncbi:MAG: HAD-superfamily hydrolase, subfamily [Proteobacteria bacterium]|nr:HAD-superfamily hydrolase, subfamily [Pseudomonadota bacterium]